MKEPAKDSSALEWNFDGVPDQELEICQLWEYARESAFIRDIHRRSEEALRRRLNVVERLEFAQNDFAAMFRVLGRSSILFQQGIYAFGGHQRFPGFISPFPKPWQSLSRHQRSVLIETTNWDIRNLVEFPAFRRAGVASTVALTKRFKPRPMRKVFGQDSNISVGEFYHSGNKLRSICPNYMHPNGLEVLAVEIEWGRFTNQQLVAEFAQWVKENRPPTLKGPDGRGRSKMVDYRANLTRLAVMRLLSQHTPLDIVDPRRDKIPAVWQTKQFSRPKWRDVTKWHDARREAGRLFRKLFPFLPPTEQPLSWDRQASVK